MSSRLATAVPHGPQPVGAEAPDVNVAILGFNFKCINTGLTDDHLVTWIARNDGTQVLCCCEYPDAQNDLFQRAKSLATDLLELEGGVANYLVSIDD